MKRSRVTCQDIHFAYDDVPVLAGISLEIEPGEFFALLGPSGSGKSTLLRVIAGFVAQQRGKLAIDGRDVDGQPAWARGVGMVFQNYALWPHMDVWHNVAFGLEERRVSVADLKRRVGAMLELVGLSALAERMPAQLSGGQQQRVALARTLVTEPQVLLLDEPLSNLDKSLRVQMRQELLALQRRLGLTTIFVTHDQEEAMTTADRMAVIDQGVVQQVGVPATLYDYPRTAFVAGFVGTMNMLPGVVQQRLGDRWVVRVPEWGDLGLGSELDLCAEQAVTLALRPHTVRLDLADARRDARYAWLPAGVEALEFHGEFTRYRVRVGERLLAVDQPHFTGLSKHAVGSAVAVGLDLSQVRVFEA